MALGKQTLDPAHINRGLGGRSNPGVLARLCGLLSPPSVLISSDLLPAIAIRSKGCC